MAVPIANQVSLATARNMAVRIAKRIYLETALRDWVASSADTKILCLLRFLRYFAFSGVTLILALFLTSLDVSVQRIGLFMTLTLLGDVVISLILTIVADRIGRRRTLALGSTLMIVSGVVFALSNQFWLLLFAAIIGVISPSGNEVGPFKAIEESTISDLVSYSERSGVFAWYMLAGSFGAGIGILLFGWTIRSLQVQHGVTILDSYRIVFWTYAVLGLLMTLLCFVLSPRCEPVSENVATADDPTSHETSPLLQDATVSPRPTADETGLTTPKTTSSAPPSLSRETMGVLFRLCMLLGLDSFASGLATASWMTYYFSSSFHITEGQLGSLFSVASILSAASNLFSAPLTRRIGLIKTMVFTHVPASLALAALPLSNNIRLAMTFLLLRASVNSMDQAPRQAFLAAAVSPAERTAVNGIVNVIKTLSQTAGPYVTGMLASKGRFGVAFIVAGALKIVYDILLLTMFLGYRTIEEQAQDRVHEEDQCE